MKTISLCAMSMALLQLCAVEMVKVPGGNFTMGDAKGAKDEQPVKVSISPFLIDKYEVTQKDYETITGQNPSRFRGDKRPVERTRWADAVNYCNLRSQKEGLTPCYKKQGNTWVCDFGANGYRLPTEAEWEYACRAGKEGKFYFSGRESALIKYAWIRSNSNASTQNVGLKTANDWGICDMYGNVAEWCNDYYAEKLTGGDNPTGPATGTKRVLRGGSWQDRPKRISSSQRTADDPATADICQGYDTYGFRCVRRADK